MDDPRIWEFERSLWLGDAKRYHDLIDDACVMVVPSEPFVLSSDRGRFVRSNQSNVHNRSRDRHVLSIRQRTQIVPVHRLHSLSMPLGRAPPPQRDSGSTA